MVLIHVATQSPIPIIHHKWGLTLVVLVHTSTKKVLYIAYYELGVFLIILSHCSHTMSCIHIHVWLPSHGHDKSSYGHNNIIMAFGRVEYHLCMDRNVMLNYNSTLEGSVLRYIDLLTNKASVY